LQKFAVGKQRTTFGSRYRLSLRAKNAKVQPNLKSVSSNARSTRGHLFSDAASVVSNLSRTLPSLTFRLVIENRDDAFRIVIKRVGHWWNVSLTIGHLSNPKMRHMENAGPTLIGAWDGIEDQLKRGTVLPF
jgi:hypothetical protein